MKKTASLARSLGKLSKRWLDRGFSFRKKAVRRLVERSGFSEKMSQALLDGLFRELTTPKLLRLLKSEIGDSRVLDEFKSDPVTGVRRRARGPGRVLHIFSANVPNPAILSFIFGMLIRSDNTGKVSSRDPGFLDIYLASLKEHDRALAKTNRLLDPLKEGPLSGALDSADLIVVYGSDETLKKIKTRAPALTPLVGYGHRLSVSVFTKEVLTRENLERLARATARDIWMTDRRGCLSPQRIYLEKSGQVGAGEFGRALASQLRRLKAPPSDFYSKQTEKIRSLSSAAAVGGCRVSLKTFSGAEGIRKELGRFKKHLQAAALETSAARRKTMAELLSGLGVNRVCRAGRMQAPPLCWHHDGRPNLAGWLRWTDLEG